MLLQILEYMRRERVASNQQIAREFHIAIEALQPMLNCWLQKGVIDICQKNGCQQRCFKCQQQAPVYYAINTSTTWPMILT